MFPTPYGFLRAELRSSTAPIHEAPAFDRFDGVPTRASRPVGLRIAVPAEEWVKRSGFYPLSQRETFEALLGQVKTAMENYRDGQPLPTVIFDLDDTLFVTAPRTARILTEWLATADIDKDIHDRLAAVEVPAYSNPDTFIQAGLSLDDPRVKAAFKSFNTFWSLRFFSNDYLKYDTVQAGAVAFVQEIYKLGAGIAYITGRNGTTMRAGTEAALRDAKFPLDDARVKLILQSIPGASDTVFKSEAATQLATTCKIVGSLDNSPGNIVMFKDLFPRAMIVFVDTVYGKGPYDLRYGLYKVRDFVVDNSGLVP